MRRSRWLLAAAVVVLVAGFVFLEPGRYLTLEHLKAQQNHLQTVVDAHPVAASAIAFAVYAGATALSIPGAVIMTLAAGSVFGLLWGTVLVSFASTLGATVAFLLARYFLRDRVESRFGHRLAALNRGIRADGPTYLLTLRLIPLVPFFIVNLLMGLTPISARQFYLYSQLGMLPPTVVFVNAGTQLGQIERASDVLSPSLLVSFVLLGLFPLLARHTLAWYRYRRFLQRYPPPAQFDRNVIVIGAGSAGLVSALIASAVNAKVTLIEQERMGGDCLNTGCVPSKALIRAARHLHDARTAERLGIRRTSTEFDFAEVMERVQSVIRTIEPHDSIERFTDLGVECLRGTARLISPWRVAVDSRELTARAIILATGARPLIPTIPGLEQVPYLTSDTLWELRELPRRLLILGGGPIGCELAQAFARFGTDVTVVDMAPRLLPREDDEVSEFIEQVFRDEGITLNLATKAVEFKCTEDGDNYLRARQSTPDGDTLHDIVFDRVLLAVGRQANVDHVGLEALGVHLSERGTVAVNDYLETHLPSVFACGDVAGPYQFTHTASHQAWYATVNALFGDLKRFAVDYRVIPWCTFTDPEIARVGLSENEARAQGIAFEVTRYGLDELDRAITDGSDRGWVKVLTVPGRDRILGATIVGEHAGELIAEFILAMKHNLGLNKILGTIHIYPTLSEANKFAAGAWRRAHASPTLLRWLERYHRRRRN